MTTGTRRRFASYDLIACVGVGGSADIWSARKGGEQVAIKILRTNVDSDARARLERELAVARIPHVNIVRMIEIVEHEGRVGLVMELCRGSLADWQRAHGPLPAARLVDLGIEALNGLAEAHRAGLVHRDIKPGNLLVGYDARIKLADFGLAQWLDDSHTFAATSALWGTLPFVAPERRYGEGIDARADLYSLAATLAWLGLGSAAGELFVPAVRERLCKRLPARLVDVLAKAGAYTPGERYPDAVAMAAALHELRDELPTAAIDWTELARPAGLDTHHAHESSVRGHGRAHLRPVAYASLAIAAALGFAVYAGRRDSTPEDEHDRARPDLPSCTARTDARRFLRRDGPRETMDAVAEDLDRDGHLDVVFVNQLDESLTIYWGGEELMAAPERLPVERSGARPAIGDVDHDGHVDLVVTSPDSGSLALLRGRAGRAFAAPESFRQAPAAARIGLLDWDGDGELDLLLQLIREEGCTAWRRGHGDGRFTEHECIGPDSRVMDPFGTAPVAVYRRTDDARIVRHRPGAAHQMGAPEHVVDLVALRTGSPASIIVRDNDGDGLDELYLPALAWPEIALLRADPDGTACVSATWLGFDAGDLADVVDLDRDGYLDAIGRSSCSGCESNHLVSLGVPK